jgi:xanthine/CO dehydrogenase XdhC/CoxF family maturation factor
VDEEGHLTGNVSGGCLEQDLRDRALRVIAAGAAERVHYSTGDEDDLVWGLGMGCNGQVDVLVTPSPAVVTPSVLESARERLAGNRAFTLAYGLDNGEQLGVVSVSEEHPPACAGVFAERLKPPPTLFVCGAGDDAVPLVQLAAKVGFRVVVLDHRKALLREDRFPAATACLCARGGEAHHRLEIPPGCFAVIMTHILEQDQAWLAQFARCDARYLGLLGSRARGRQLMAAVGLEEDERVFGPVGLDLGAEGPEQVALSVVAELLARQAGRRAGHLKDHDGPIHQDRCP